MTDRSKVSAYVQKQCPEFDQKQHKYMVDYVLKCASQTAALEIDMNLMVFAPFDPLDAIFQVIGRNELMEALLTIESTRRSFVAMVRAHVEPLCQAEDVDRLTDETVAAFDALGLDFMRAEDAYTFIKQLTKPPNAPLH